MRIQFDISPDLWNRMKNYVSEERMRHFIAKDALEEWITRREGRDKKLREERLISDIAILKPIIQKMFEDGEISIK